MTPLRPTATATPSPDTPAINVTLRRDSEPLGHATPITTVDRVTVSVTVTAPAFAGEPRFDPPIADQLESAGWSVVRAVIEPPAAESTPGVIRFTTTVTVEPFLDGSYAVPAFTAAFPAASPTSNARSDLPQITSVPATVSVVSVIADDPAELEAAIAQIDPALLSPPAEPAAPGLSSVAVALIAAAAAAAVGGSTAMIIRAASRKKRDPDPIREAGRELDAAEAAANTGEQDRPGSHAASDRLPAAL
ncbi:MAG: hypothetical protein AAF235_02800, partial [Planctomycetota bacterium]